MSTDRDVTRVVRSWLREDAHEDADRILDIVLDEIDTTPQRRAGWLARRFPPMNSNILRIALAAAAVVLIAFLGYQYFGNANAGGPGPSESAGRSATAEPSVAAPSPSSAPALSETFTSSRHGISISYPTGWVTRPATEVWTAGAPDFASTAGDVLHDPVRQDHLWIVVASQAIGDSTPEEWVAEKLALDDGCTASEPITVDGAAGLIGADDCTRAAITIDGRGYFIWLYVSSDEPSLPGTYGRTWFEQVLETVQLQPADAVDVAP